MNLAPFDIVTQSVGRAFGVSVAEIRSRSRLQKTAVARQVAMAILRDQFHYSIMEIARLFDRHHGSVISACRSVEDVIKTKDRLYFQHVKTALRLTSKNRQS